MKSVGGEEGVKMKTLAC